MTYLNDGTITVSLGVGLDSTRNGANISDSRRTIGGREQTFFWNNYDGFDFSAQNVPSSDAAQVNEWWRNQTQLTLVFDGVTYTTRIVGNQPFSQVNKPYFDEWKGQIMVERI